MLILQTSLQMEFAGSAPTLDQVREQLPMLGFPIDGIDGTGAGTVLEVDITANRGDVMSHRGLARDLAAGLGLSLVPLPVSVQDEGAPIREIRLETAACPIYATAELSLGAGTTPEAVVAFLGHLGATAKGLPAVDASNELLHRYGHPTHAFDADLVQGSVTVRLARAGESLVTLDGVTRTLHPEDVLIADEKGPIALAGVMGGERTKVTEATTRVLLESAYFEPRPVRLTARRHNLHSDASHRFGRGADPRMPRVARDLLVGRLKAWAGGTVLGVWAVGEEPELAAPIPLRLDLLNRIAGEAIELGEAGLHLQRLGCAVEAGDAGLSAVSPSWRHDLAIPEDLAEEVLRLRGYHRLKSVLPPLDANPEPLHPGILHAKALSSRLAHLGFHQAVTYGFISPEADAEFARTPLEGRCLGNPLGYEYSVMRGSLLPSLRSAALHNLRQGARDIRLFELAPTYESSPSGPVARPVLGIVWGGVLEGLAPLGTDQARPRPVHPADLLGLARSLGASEASLQELGEGLYGLELAVENLPRAEERIIPDYGQRMKQFSRIPAVERDLSLMVEVGLDFKALREVMAAGAGEMLVEPPRLVEIYRPKAQGTQAWLFRFTFRHPERSLTREEVDGWMQSALSAARSQGVELRG